QPDAEIRGGRVEARVLKELGKRKGDRPMKQTVALTVSSMLTILFSMFHLTDDILRGNSPGGLSNFIVVLVLAAWLYVILTLIDRRSGLVVTLILSFLVSGVPAIHMTGTYGMTGNPKYSGGFFFGWTNYALGVTAVLSVLLSVRGLWSLRRGQQ